MSESTTLREAIARALYEHHAAGLGGRGAHSWEEIVEGGENRPYPEFPHLVDEFRARADAVLPVLADPPAEVIEQAAKGIDPDAFTMTRDEYRSLYGAFPAGARMTAKGEVKAAFQAALGGEQA